MSLALRRSDDFSGDFDLTYRWYLQKAGEMIARRFLEATWHTVETLAEHPGLGTARKFSHPELQGLRSLRVQRPFQTHLIFYRANERELSLQRLMHGRRDLPRRLREPPGTTAR